MANHYRWNNAPPTVPDTHRYKYNRNYVDWRGVRPERAPKNQNLSWFNKNLRLDPLKFEVAKQPNNIFERYNIGNPDLPAHKHEKEIIDTIEANKVSILSGATGSGKTTQLPQMMLKAGYDHIFVLQPRRINADGGDRVETEIRSKMGDAYPEGLVGVGHSERMTISSESMVDFMTAGTFLNMLPQIQKKFTGKKVGFVVDETHENGLPTEFASALGLQAVEEEANWRMVYASATPDDTLKNNVALAGVNGKEVPEIHIEGQPQDIEYSEAPDEDIIETYVNQAGDSKKAMIFVEGIPAAKEAKKELLKSMSKADIDRTRIFLLSSSTTKREKQAIKDMRLGEGERAVIISTAAGQSGITIPGLDLVVLSGITRSPEIDDEKADGLPIRLDTQAELTQKGGRTGRDVPGRVILSSPLVEHKNSDSIDEIRKFTTFGEREADIPPEVYHTSLSRNALMVAAMGRNFEVTNNYMKNRLSNRSIADANDVLFNLDALDENDVITPIGARMDKYSLRPELSRAMIEFETNTERNVQIQALAIAAAIDNGGLIDHYGSKAWKDVLRPTSTDDYLAQLDLMIESRPFYHGLYVDERELKLRGISPLAAQRIHHRFDKMSRVMGIDDAYGLEIEPTTLDQERLIKETFLLGMPELIFEHTSTERGIDYYKNTAGFQEPLERKISNRSVMATKVGRRAVSHIVGFPRWFTDKNGTKQDVVELGFKTNSQTIQSVMGHKALRAREPEMRGGQLVNIGPAKLGGIEIGGKQTAPLSARSDHEKGMLAQRALDIGTPAVEMLRSFKMSDGDIFEALFSQAEGTSSAGEVDSRLWDLVSQRQSEFAAKN